jgi:hypothetical protein
MGKKLTTILFGTPKPPKLPEMPESPGALPVVSEYDGGNLPERIQKTIQSGAPVIDVPQGYIKAQKKAARAAQKAARKAQKKAGVKSGFFFGAPQSRTSTADATQNTSGMILVREARPATGRKGFIPYIIILMLFALVAAHLYGIF